jgi:hypothetical protein
MNARGPRRRRGPVGAVAGSLARRRFAREPRVVVRDGAGRCTTLAPDDPAARRLTAAAERLVSAVQRGSAV